MTSFVLGPIFLKFKSASMQKLAKEFNYLKNPIQGVKKFHLPILFYDTADMLMSGERCHVPPISICPNLNNCQKLLYRLTAKQAMG